MVIFVCFSVSNIEFFEFDYLEMQESQVWNVVKNVVVVVVIFLVLSVFFVQVREGNVFFKFFDNFVGEVVSIDFFMYMDGVKVVYSQEFIIFFGID